MLYSHAFIFALALLVLPDSTYASKHGLRSRARQHSRVVDERKLPITTTTTVTVRDTSTFTVWTHASTDEVQVGGTTTSETKTDTGTWSSGTATFTDTATSNVLNASPTVEASVPVVTANVTANATTAGSSTWFPTETLTATPTAGITESQQNSTTLSPTLSANATEPTASLSEEAISTSATSTVESVTSFVPNATVTGSLEATATSSVESTPTSSIELNATLSIGWNTTATESLPTATQSSGPVVTDLAISSIASDVSSASASRIATSIESSIAMTLAPVSTASPSVSSAGETGSQVLDGDVSATSFETNATSSISATANATVDSAQRITTESASVMPTELASNTMAITSALPNSTASPYIPGIGAPGKVPSYPTPSTSSLAQSSTIAASSSTASFLSVESVSITVNSSNSSISSSTSSSAAPQTSSYVGMAPPGKVPSYPSPSSSAASLSSEAASSQATTAPVSSAESSATSAASIEIALTSSDASSATPSTTSAYVPGIGAPGKVPTYPTVTRASSSAQSSANPTLDLPSLASTSVTSASLTESVTVEIAGTSTATSTFVPSASVTSLTSTTSTSISSSTASSASPASTGSTGLSTAHLNSRMVAAYYPDWTAWSLPPSSLDFSRLDCVDFAFAIPNAQFALEFTQWNSESTLRALVAAGHAAGKKVRLSIGGWTGSVYFSDAVSNDQNRHTFANNIAATYASFGLDGIDLDWEYPGGGGAGGNHASPSDSANYLIFLRLLRATLPSDAILSTATQVWPFADANGRPMTDVSGFAQVLDWVLVMNYDIWGSSDNPGPNAPLSDGCGTSTQPLANAYAAVSSWTTAGMPASQIMLGIPAYGYLQMSSASSLRTRKRRHTKKQSVTVTNADGGNSWGQVNFDSLVSQGALYKNAQGEYVGGGGFTREWDACSSTPWLKSTSSGQIITYDDPASISLKAQFARQAGLRGTNMWEISGDTSDWALTDAARSGLGL